MFNKNSGVFLFLMLTIFLCGSILFLNGFFPDAYVKSEASEESVIGAIRPTNVKGLSILPPQKKYSQIILMVVDALRFNFVSPTDPMPFVHMNRCNRLKMKVAIPTVTLPRIKSLMTGTISNFIDIIRNLGETEQLTDSLLHILKEHNLMVNFVGDRTWTGLFPNQFTRKKSNVDSFFVHDFYEGDRQVIETMRQELNQVDWSLFILHFLGLDHIGHVEGSNSPRIMSKLLEMDYVVKEIIENDHFENRLLLLTGDHGMREGGGHGGSTEEELTVPLLFFNKYCDKYDGASKEYNQIDLAPTMSILLSVEIPKSSIGCLIPELLTNFTQEERLYAYFYNAHHLIRKANVKYGENNVRQTGYTNWFEEAQIAHKHFIETSRQGLPGSFYYEQAFANYKRVAHEISNRMSESLVKFDYGLIGVGLFLTTATTIYTLTYLNFAENHPKYGSKSAVVFNSFLWLISLTIALILNISSQEMELITVNSFQRNCLFTALMTIGVFISLNILRQIQKLILPLSSATRLKFVWSYPKPLLAAYVMTICLLCSSSYIELEHKSWHYLGVTCLLLLVIQTIRQNLYNEEENCKNGEAYFIAFLHKKKTELLNALIMLSMLRILSSLNATYNRRWSSWIQEFKEFSLTLLLLGSLVLLIKRLNKFLTARQRIASMGVVFSIFLYRVFQGNSLFFPIAKFGSLLALSLFWILLLIIALIEFKKCLSTNGKLYLRLLQSGLSCSFLVAALLHQPHNVIMLPCLLYVLDQTYNFCDKLQLHMREPYKQRYKLAYKTFMTIFLGQMFFFYQGNSNSLATINLNPGYIGQSTYNPIIVAIFVTLNTYCAPIHAFFYLILHVITNEIQDGHEFIDLSIQKKYFVKPFQNENLQLVMSLYTTSTLLPVSVYLCLMILFRYHLFVYSVFAPKVFYECYRVLVYYLIYCGLNIFLYVFK